MLSAVRTRLLLVILGTLLLVVPGPGYGEPNNDDPRLGQGASDKTDPTAQLSKLQSVLFSYADKYMSAIIQVAFLIQRQDPTNPDLRLRMHSLKLLVTSSVQELAVSPNPESTLLDMMVYATLHRISFEEDWARELYGEAVESLVSATQLLEREIWEIASGYLADKEIAEVRNLIHAWKVENPELKLVSYIRFSDFASMRSKSPLVEKARKSGFLVDTSDAVKAVDQALLLAERVLHYSQRLPLIVDERQASIEHLASIIAAERSAAIHELADVLAVERHATIAELSQSISVERVAFFGELDAREKMLSGIVIEVRKGLGDANKLTVDLEQTAKAINEVLLNADKLMARFDPSPEVDESDSEPFDINSYVTAIKELTIAIQEANTLLLSTERLTSRENLIGGVFDRVLWTGTILIIILCVAVFFTMLIYRSVARRIVPRSSFEYVGPPPANRQEI